MGYVKRGDAKPGPLKEQLMTTTYNEEELNQIARLNFENWIHYNRGLIQVLYKYPKNLHRLEKYREHQKIKNLIKLLKLGIDYGVTNLRGGWHLTDEAEKYYKSLLLRDGEDGLEEEYDGKM